MTDIALLWSPDLSAADMALGGGALVTDDGLRTAILISLFTDARAPADALLADAGDDPRGWWADAELARPDDSIGSTLWLLRRAKNLPGSVEQARQAARAALDWLIRDGIAQQITVSASAEGSPATLLAISVVLDRPAGPGRQRYDFTWEASTGKVTAA